MKKVIVLFCFILLILSGCRKNSDVTEPEAVQINKEEIPAVLSKDLADYDGCEGLILEPNLRGGNFLVRAGESYTFTVEYRVIACGSSYSDVRLTGELVRNAGYKYCNWGNSTVKFKNSNTYFSWNAGDISSGTGKLFSVTFSLKIPDVPYGTMVPVTGGWIVEGKNGSGFTETAGNYNEIFVQVQ